MTSQLIRTAPSVWDVVLYPTEAPAERPARPAGRISPRAAFQQLVHDRVLLIDLRETAERRAQGEVSAALHPRHVPATELAGWLADHQGELDTVVLLSGHGVRSAAVQRWLARRLPEPAVLDLAGGFEAWQAAGMPVD